MALLETLTLTKSQDDRGSGQHSFVVPIPDACTNLGTMLEVYDGGDDPALYPLAYETKVVTRSLHADGDDVRLVDITVDDGNANGSTGTFLLQVHDSAGTVPAARPAPTLAYNEALVNSLLEPGKLKLYVHYYKPTKYLTAPASVTTGLPPNESVDLGDPDQRYYHRRGDLRTTTIDRHVLQSGLELIVSIDYRAGETQIDVDCMVMNGGIDESLSASVEFQKIRWSLPLGVTWQPVEWDPVGTAGQRGFLVNQATSAEGTHIVNQRCTRVVSGYITLEGATPIKTFAGLGSATAAFSTHEAAIGGTAMPTFTGLAALRTALDADYASEKAAALAVASSPQAGGQTPPSALWLTAGTKYGGTTGGTEVDPYEGALAANSASADHWEHHRLMMTRWRSRQPTAIYAGGWPIFSGDYLDANNSAPWAVGEHVGFEKLYNQSAGKQIPKDEPFDFYDIEPDPPGHSESVVDWLDPYLPFVDFQHYVRVFKDALALAWYTNHPIAWMFVQMDAQLMMMCFNPYDGFRQRFQAPTGLTGLGWEQGGRSVAWGSLIMTHARAQNIPRLDTYYDTWLDRFVDLMEHHQLPSGLFGAHNTNKEATQVPFGNGSVADFYVFRATQQPKVGLALWASKQLRPTGSNKATEVDTLVDALAQGIYNFCWQQDLYDGPSVRTGPITKYVAGPNRFSANGGSGSTQRYSSYEEVPATNPYPGPQQGGTILLSDSDNNMASTFVGIAEKVGATDGLNMARKLTGNFPAGTGPTCTASMEAWDPSGEALVSGKKASTWAPTLGYFQKLHP